MMNTKIPALEAEAGELWQVQHKIELQTTHKSYFYLAYTLTKIFISE